MHLWTLFVLAGARLCLDTDRSIDEYLNIARTMSVKLNKKTH